MCCELNNIYTYPHVRSAISLLMPHDDGRENYKKMIITQFPVKSFIIKKLIRKNNNDFIVIILSGKIFLFLEKKSSDFIDEITFEIVKITELIWELFIQIKK